MENIKQAKYGYEYPRAAVTTDCVIFGYDLHSAALQILLIERGIEPFKGRWALPGGFLRVESETDEKGLVISEKNESLMECALRELKEETGLEINYIQEVGTFSQYGRDPRGASITDAYFALVNIQKVQGGDDAKKAEWFSLKEILEQIEQKGQVLAFDHDEILKKAYNSLQKELFFHPLGFDLLPTVFTMNDLQGLYEAILCRKFDRRNFSRKLRELGIIELLPTNTKPSRKTPLHYRFNKAHYDSYKTSSERPRIEF